MGLIYLIVDSIMSIRKKSIKRNAKRNFDTKTVSFQNRYSIDIPTILNSSKNISKDASIQYYNKALDMGIVVIDEPKSQFIEEWENIKSQLDEDLTETLVDKVMSVTLFNMMSGEDVEPSNYQEKLINGMPSVSVEVFKSRTFLKDASYTHITCIEGKNTIYQVIAIIGGTSIPDFSSRLSEIASTLIEL